ncbi:MAG: tetratricopeptide repeat protein [Bryobacteraceae bacterium]|nr:tetratricopeptide repeat protein [Bryobacteraceae bacterium]
MEELQVRTHLINDAGLLQQYTDLTAPEIQKIAVEEDAGEYRRLLPLASLFDVEAAFKPLNNSGERQYLEGALTHAADTEQVLVNTGAIDFLLELRTMMHDGGFVLINDYGPTTPEQSFAYSATQRFGRTTAQGLNFPLLDTILSLNSWSVETPAADAERSIHSRLLVRSELPLTFECFQNRFSADSQNLFESPLAEGRDHSNAGRKGPALECYRTAVARSPRDWRVLGEAAEFVGLELKDFGSGIQLAQAAVELNPWYSSWLWNVLGDCLFCAGRYTDAHEAYLQAQRVSPTDPRTNLNLSYTWLHLGDFEEALRAIGTGLAGDAGAYRPRMMEKQVAILATMDAQRAGEQDRFMRRAGRLLVRKDPVSATAHPAT